MPSPRVTRDVPRHRSAAPKQSSAMPGSPSLGGYSVFVVETLCLDSISLATHSMSSEIESQLSKYPYAILTVERDRRYCARAPKLEFEWLLRDFPLPDDNLIPWGEAD